VREIGVQAEKTLAETMRIAVADLTKKREGWESTECRQR